MRKKTIHEATGRVEMTYRHWGSVLKGTVESEATSCTSHFVVDSPEPRDDVLEVVRLAKRGCFAERLVGSPVPLESTFEINGERVDVDL